MNLTSVFSKNIEALQSGKRFIVNQGGARSSKTFSILQLLVFIAIKKQNKRISIISESLPHLKKGAIADFEKILKTDDLYGRCNVNLTDRIYSFGSSSIEFFSAEDSGKVTGPARDILFINECNNVPFSIFDQAEVRTSETIFLDFNPVQEFWVHDRILIDRKDDAVLIKSTYLDNNLLHDNIRRTIEARRERDPEWWKVYGLGELGKLEGLIFPSFEVVDAIPVELTKRSYGMDFGFTNDPTTLIEVALTGDDIYLHEHLYQTAMTSSDIIKFVRDIGLARKEIICDSADPKTIAELNKGGLNATGAKKGPDSIRGGIDQIKKYRIKVTKESTNLIKELRNYRWKTNKQTGKSENEPIDDWCHLIDATRYAIGQQALTAPRFWVPEK